MAGRSGRRRVDSSSPLVDLDVVFADDKFVDAIAAQPWGATDWRQYNSGAHGRAHTGSARGGQLTVDRQTVDPLTDLLASWREELAVSPMPAPPDARRAPVRLQQRRPSRGRRLRPAMAIAAAIAALLVGSASIGSKEASRDSLLWALTEVLWPSRAESVASADQVQAALVEARFALDDGRSQDAQLALLRATVALGGVDRVDGRDDMQQTVAELWVRAAPQGLPTGTQPSEFVSHALPAAAQSDRPAESTAAVAAGTAGDEQLAAPQGVPAPIAQSPAPPAGTSQTTPGAGSSSASAQPSTANSSGGSTATSADTQAAAPVSSDQATAGPTGTASGTPTPAPSTAPVTSTAEVAAAQPTSAPAQSAPAPTPSEPAHQLDASTDSQSAAGTTGDSNAAAGSSATGDSVADTSADQQTPIQSIPLDPAAVGSG